MKCCICGCEVEGFGNNPNGACWLNERGDVVEAEFDADCRCCDECNTRYVIPGRIYKLNKARRRDK